MALSTGRVYRFSSTFTLEAPAERVHAVFVDLEHYSEWWPQVRAVARIDDDHALVVCRSTLPYDLELLLSAVSRHPQLLQVGIEGPINGFARFRLTEQSGSTVVEFEQEVTTETRLLVAASYVARPLLVWNHQRMVQGLVSGAADRLQSSAASTES